MDVGFMARGYLEIRSLREEESVGLILLALEVKRQVLGKASSVLSKPSAYQKTEVGYFAFQRCL